MGRREHFSSGVYHGSEHPPEYYLNSPVLHVGSYGAAQAALQPAPWDEYEEENDVDSKITAFDVAPTAKVHRITVPDKIANEAHAHFLREQGMPVSQSVEYSRSHKGTQHPLVRSALNALRQGKIVPYENEVEMERDAEGWAVPQYDESGKEVEGPEISYMVPNPKLNLKQFTQNQ